MPRRRRSRRGLTLKLVLIIFLAVLVLGGGSYAVWFSDIFTVRAIEVEGARLVDKDVISGPVEGNILFWDLPVNADELPQVKSIKVSKDYVARTIRISVEERGKVLIWCGHENEVCFWVDDGGLIFTNAPIPEGTLVVNVVKDSTGRDLEVGNKVLPDDLFANLKYAIGLFEGLDVSIEEIRLNELKFKEAVAVISGGPEVYLSLNIDPRFGKGVLETLMDSPDWGRIRYVDLRVENRAYYSF